VTHDEIASLMQAIAPVLKSYIADLLSPMHERLAAIEGKGIPTYVGIYQPDTTWEKGSVCTFNGGLWHANRATAQKPGDDGSGWQLCVKSGGDLAEKRISTLEREVRELTKPRAHSGLAEPRR
jgi:hypothetical protein